MQPNSDGNCSLSVCNVPYCSVCTPMSQNTQICLLCNQGYALNSYFQCVQYSSVTTVNCSVPNCLYCPFNNYCDFCIPDFLPYNGSCRTSTYCNVTNCLYCQPPDNCVVCNPSYIVNLSNNSCTPLCNISNCLICDTLNNCSLCSPTFILNSVNTSCIC
jgi:hypothetical protein